MLTMRPCGRSVHIFPAKVLFCLFAVLFSVSVVVLLFDASPLKNPTFEIENDLRIQLENSRNFQQKINLANLTTSSIKYSHNGMINSYVESVNDINNRIKILEEKILNLEVKSGLMQDRKMVPNQLMEIQQNPSVECPFPKFDGYVYCEVKLKWMREMWKSDKCYEDWGVDGSECSIYKFLSEVEQWCPPINLEHQTNVVYPDTPFELAVVKDNLTGLYEILGDNFRYKWMKMRIQRMEKQWLEAGQIFASKYKTKWRKKKILLHMGLLSDESGWKIGENAFKGGPLGELVQWADLMTSLYVIGHDITITVSTADLRSTFDEYIIDASENCPLKATPFDVVYIDIRGMQMLRKVARKKFHLLQCRLRSVDSFGTEPEFNNPHYAARKQLTSQWGKWNLEPKQFNTMFPHTPDNTFLGFVIEQHGNMTAENLQKQNIALVYGKVDKFWKDKFTYIEALHSSSLEIHGTVDASNPPVQIPSFVINHGVLPGDELQALLRKTKVFVGMGFPYEGPAPLEAIANGAVFLNPTFSPATKQSEAAAKFYKGKPTFRRPNSQHPYAEIFIGPPHVRMVDIDDLEVVKSVVEDILNSPDVGPYMPHEFTWLGMIERLAHQVEMQDFCRKKKEVWPPLSAMQVIESDQSETCRDSCQSRGLVCEPTYFHKLNAEEAFKQLSIKCDIFLTPHQADEDSAYPAHRDGMCYLQSNSKLFSCAGRQTNARRLCPCRDYLKGQVALCKDCLLP
uniref:alpha-1,6-mannosyl-glycoprotein 6-beta-N-acetylglucosaminyltransferase n=1 Tax=Phallusia mammillata TaxID=59560 RepID=A0A6F9DLE3_9ASCI|nr:alpha-1,6-mannosylglycoprotein 6-beta-N-acetylglucosaminyltransferase A-like [Phallusia mammillata]